MLISRRKRYLSGADWVISALDLVMKRTTCSGNSAQIVLILDAPLDEASLCQALEDFLARFPVLAGTLARDWRLAPCWRIPVRSRPAVRLQTTRVVDLATPGGLHPDFERSVNRRFQSNAEHVAFHLVTDGTKSALVMIFDHRLLDARGAEAFLELFRQTLGGSPPDGPIAFASAAALTHWREKFLAGRNVNRRIIALAKSSPRVLPMATGRDRGYRYRLMTFTPQESTAIYERAYREAGYLMESPFFLAVITRAMHRFFASCAGDGDSYLLPVTVDLRPGKEPLQEVFFNHLSYLFYQVPLALGDDLPGLIAAFKGQMYDQVKSGFPADLAKASLLMRIAPLAVLGRMLYLPLNGKMATFVYSHLGKSAYAAADFMGRGVENLIHMPRVPAPPGLGFFSNLYNGRLNLVMSYLDGMLTDADADRIEAGIRAGFGGDRS